jgi:hypothetical protein
MFTLGAAADFMQKYPTVTESLEDVHFRFHGEELPAISAYIVKPETLPKDIRQTMRNSPIMDSDENETITENLRNRIPSTYQFGSP